MADDAYVVDAQTKKLTLVKAASLADLGVRERRDLERWICDTPEVLGEELLLISSEFDRFDKSARRLDILALDRDGKLVVVELKLALEGTYADQQALRYAAFCSTMTMDGLIQHLAAYRGWPRDKAAETVREFLDLDELPELDDRPRIILAAGSLDDEELISTVLWLRKFELDITCVELTPYRLSPNGPLVVVPRVIVPLPEAKEYTVQVEQKESAQAKASTRKSRYSEFWRAIAAACEALKLPFGFRVAKTSRNYLQVYVGATGVHYEWWIRPQEKRLEVGLHFESADHDRNHKLVSALVPLRDKISEGVKYQFYVGDWSKIWTTARFWVPLESITPTEPVIQEAMRIMKLLMERTWPTLEPLLHPTD